MLRWLHVQGRWEGLHFDLGYQLPRGRSSDEAFDNRDIALLVMMLLRGGVLRRLCGLSVRQFSAAADATAVASTASVGGERENITYDVGDLMGHVSLREARKSRTRAKVESQLHTFLRSSKRPLHHLTTLQYIIP